MRKFLLLFFIALSLFFVLSQVQEEDRTPSTIRQAHGGEQSRTTSSGQADRTQRNVPSISVILEFEDSRYEVFVPQGSTVYDLMDKASSQYSFSFSGKNFPGIGFFIEEIKGVRQDPKKGLYWIYSINGQVAQVGVSNYILKPNDVITWKYEKGY